MSTELTSPESGMLLSMQMVADPLAELLWDFTLETTGDCPSLRCCQVYCGQTSLQDDTLYLIPQGMGGLFPAN